MNNLGRKELVTYGIIALGFAVQWGIMSARAQAQGEQLVNLSRKVDTVAEIKSDLSVLKEIALDSRTRIVRIENKMLRPVSP